MVEEQDDLERPLKNSSQLRSASDHSALVPKWTGMLMLPCWHRLAGEAGSYVSSVLTVWWELEHTFIWPF